jgi:hypothetical protein
MHAIHKLYVVRMCTFVYICLQFIVFLHPTCAAFTELFVGAAKAMRGRRDIEELSRAPPTFC